MNVCLVFILEQSESLPMWELLEQEETLVNAEHEGEGSVKGRFFRWNSFVAEN